MSVKYTEKIKNCYLVELSTKRTIQIDEEELQIVIKAIQSGQQALLKQGMFNPSFYVCIVKDEKRIFEIIEDNNRNRFNIGQGTAKPRQLKPLEDIFAGSTRQKLLGYVKQVR